MFIVCYESLYPIANDKYTMPAKCHIYLVMTRLTHTFFLLLLVPGSDMVFDL